MVFLNRRLSINEWLDYVASYDFGPIAPDRIVLHHTWKPTVDQWAGERSMIAMRKVYEQNGWPAGPHIYVAPDGIWLATPMSDVGVHANAGNANLEFQADWGNFKKLKWYSVGVEMVGNYDPVRPSGVIWEEAKAVLGALCKRFGKTPQAAISFHRDYSSKTCPGSAVTKDWVFAEVNNWLMAQRLEDFVVDSPIGTNIHQGPGVTFPVAGSMVDGEAFKGIIKDDAGCLAFEGDHRWVWVSTGFGFVPYSRVRRPSDSPKSGLTIAVSEPRISRVEFTRVLASVSSPATPWSCELYSALLDEHVDPAVALAFFYHESQCGNLGICHDYDTKNWGNVRAPADASLGEVVAIPGRGNFAKYPTWVNGLRDWCLRMKGPTYAGCGLTTVEAVLPKYAPAGDGNSPAEYINAVRGLVAQWQQEDK